MPVVRTGRQATAGNGSAGTGYPLIGFQLDLEILVTVGDRQRTRSDYAKLLRRTGFRLDRVVDAVTPVSIIEASPI